MQVTFPARTLADIADIAADPSVVIEATCRAPGLVSMNELRHAASRRSARVRDLIERAIAEARARP
jgi:hypothetical protein